VGTLGPNQNQFVIPRAAERGFKVHGGGVEVDTKQLPVHAYSASSSSFLRSFAAEAAGHTVATDFALPPDERSLLGMVEANTKDEGALRKQFVYLHLRILGERVDSQSEEVSQTLSLFADLDAMSPDRETTWKLVLTALFQDFRVAYH
jgi:hypothetical protein